MDTLAELFAHVLTIFFLLLQRMPVACISNVISLTIGTNGIFLMHVKPINTSFNWGNGVAPI